MVSPDVSIQGDDVSDRARDTPLPTDEMDLADEESASRNTDVQSPPMKKKQLRLSMRNTYYEDARTGYEDESDHGDVHGEDVSMEEPSSLHSAPSVPARLAALQEDLNISDDSDKEEKPAAEKSNSADGEEEDDGLWF